MAMRLKIMIINKIKNAVKYDCDKNNIKNNISNRMMMRILNTIKKCNTVTMIMQ